jgi:hypothetical protein
MTRLMNTIVGTGAAIALIGAEPVLAQAYNAEPAPKVSSVFRAGELAIVNYPTTYSKQTDVYGVPVTVTFNILSNVFRNRIDTSEYTGKKMDNSTEWSWDEMNCTGGDKVRFSTSFYPGIVEAEDNDIWTITGNDSNVCHNGVFTNAYIRKAMTQPAINPPAEIAA